MKQAREEALRTTGGGSGIPLPLFKIVGRSLRLIQPQLRGCRAEAFTARIFSFPCGDKLGSVERDLAIQDHSGEGFAQLGAQIVNNDRQIIVCTAPRPWLAGF